MPGPSAASDDTLTLKAAIKSVDLAKVERAIAVEKPINDPYNSTLQYALERGVSVEIVALLLENGSDPINDFILPGGAILTAILYKCSLEVITLLREKGATITNGPSCNTLSVAVNRGSIDIIDYLLKNGATIRNGPSRNTLSVAVNRGSIDIIDYLLKNGAEIINDSENPTNSTLYNALFEGVNPELIHFLLEQGAEPHGTLERALEVKVSVEVTDLLLIYGANPQELAEDHRHKEFVVNRKLKLTNIIEEALSISSAATRLVEVAEKSDSEALKKISPEILKHIASFAGDRRTKPGLSESEMNKAAEWGLGPGIGTEDETLDKKYFLDMIKSADPPRPVVAEGSTAKLSKAAAEKEQTP